MSRSLRVAIAGAGSTGLALASLLRQRGHAVSVYGKLQLPFTQSFSTLPTEKFAVAQPLGSGLLLQPTGASPPLPQRTRQPSAQSHPLTGLAVLAHIGADEALLKLGAKVRRLDGRTVDGRCVFDLNYGLLGKRACVQALPDMKYCDTLGQARRGRPSRKPVQR